MTSRHFTSRQENEAFMKEVFDRKITLPAQPGIGVTPYDGGDISGKPLYTTTERAMHRSAIGEMNTNRIQTEVFVNDSKGEDILQPYDEETEDDDEEAIIGVEKEVSGNRGVDDKNLKEKEKEAFMKGVFYGTITLPDQPGIGVTPWELDFIPESFAKWGNDISDYLLFLGPILMESIEYYSKGVQMIHNGIFHAKVRGKSISDMVKVKKTATPDEILILLDGTAKKEDEKLNQGIKDSLEMYRAAFNKNTFSWKPRALAMLAIASVRSSILGLKRAYHALKEKIGDLLEMVNESNDDISFYEKMLYRYCQALQGDMDGVRAVTMIYVDEDILQGKNKNSALVTLSKFLIMKQGGWIGGKLLVKFYDAVKCIGVKPEELMRDLMSERTVKSLRRIKAAVVNSSEKNRKSAYYPYGAIFNDKVGRELSGKSNPMLTLILASIIGIHTNNANLMKVHIGEIGVVNREKCIRVAQSIVESHHHKDTNK